MNDKKIISANLEQEIIELMDRFDMNRSHIINTVLSRDLGHGGIFEQKIEEMKRERNQLREKKQEIEQEIWNLDDQIEEMQDQMTEARAVHEARNQIPKEALENTIEEITFARKHRRIPTAKDANTGQVTDWKDVPDVDTVINSEAERLSNNHGVEEEAVIHILRTYTGT